MVGRTDVRKPTYTSSTPIWQRTDARPHEVINFWRGELDKPLFVYFIQHDDGGPVKIGKAYDPESRLTELQCGNPYPLNLRYVILAGPRTEISIHYAWSFASVGGEWFGERHQNNILSRARDAQQRQLRVARTRPLEDTIRLAIDALKPDER